jgi:hypothetical protein
VNPESLYGLINAEEINLDKQHREKKPRQGLLFSKLSCIKKLSRGSFSPLQIRDMPLSLLRDVGHEERSF